MGWWRESFSLFGDLEKLITNESVQMERMHPCVLHCCHRKSLDGSETLVALFYAFCVFKGNLNQGMQKPTIRPV